MIETGAVINTNDEVVHWHLPPGRSTSNLPDSPELWQILWKAQLTGWLKGFAHSHPGAGLPHPSREDISTFVAIEAALGRRLNWWITSSDRLVVAQCAQMDSMPGRVIYNIHPIAVEHEPAWVMELRRASTLEDVNPYR